MALTAGEQALYDYAVSRGQSSVSSVSVPPESLAKVNAALSSANTTTESSMNSDIYNRVQQIYTEMGNTPEANAQIAREANQYGVNASQLSGALNVPEDEVSRLASEAGVPLNSSSQYTGGSGASINVSGGNNNNNNQKAVENLADLVYRSMTTGVSTSALKAAVAAAGGDPNDPFASNDILQNAGYSVGDLQNFYTSAGDEPDDPQAKELYEARDKLLEDGTNSNLQNLGYLKSQGVDVDTSQYSPQAQQQIEEASREFKGVEDLDSLVADLSPEETQRYNQVNQLYNDLFGRDIAFEGADYWIRGGGAGAALNEETLAAAALGPDLDYYNTNVLNPRQFQELIGSFTPAEQSRYNQANELYNKLFGRDIALEGSQYWIRGEGSSAPITEETLIAAAQGEDLDYYNTFVKDAVDLSSLTDDQRAFAENLPSDLQDDYLAAVQAGFGDPASGLTLESLIALLKDRGLSFEQAAQATGLTSDDPNYQASYDAWHGTTDTGEDTTGPREATSGSIVPGQPQVGEVNIMDYMGLQAGEPTLPVGTQLEPDLQQLEATDETLQALTPETTLATGGQYVATPQDITASTVTSPTPTDAVTATASTTDLVEQPEAAQMTAEKSLEQINAEADALQAARQDLNEIDPKATVQGQLALLQEQFADGEIPVWASGAFRQVNALMAQRGLGGSTIAAEAITNALMQSALPIAQQDASFYQNVTIQNLSNEQQAEMAKFNARTSAIFNDQAAENAARSLNTQSENELSQFFAQLAQNVSLANTQQVNAMEQFNATAENQATQFFAELGLTADTFNADAINELAQFDAEQANIIAQFNANMKNQREQFNIQNQLAIDASNVQWRRDVNTQNTAATNAALQFDAQNLLAVQQTALNNIWQHYDTLLSYAFTAEESSKERALNLTISSMNAEMQRQIAEDSSFLDSITGIVSGGATLLGSESGFKIAESWGLV